MTQTLGSAIRSRRIDLGLTQEGLAARIEGGMRQAEISRLEVDRVTLPRRDRLERIARALELSVGELLERAGWAGATTAFTAPIDPAPTTHCRPSSSREQVAPRADRRQVWGD